ncbi:NPCBM/NEW2 domain-containing protein [Nonomuraea ferruginea]
MALYNSTDTLATVGVAAADTGLRRAGAYRLRDLWTGRTLQARSTISAAVPAHGTVVYRVSPLRGPGDVPPSVVAGAALGTVVPADGGTLTTAVTNRGAGDVRDVKVTVRTPEGWTATATGPSGSARLRTDAALETAWRIGVPATAAASRHPIEITAAYRWGRRSAGTSSEIVAVVVTAPGDGRRHLSTVAPVSTVNATGPVEADQSNGGPLEDDGNLITIGGRVYQRGLGTTTGSEISYYLGGRCSRLVTDVGVGDEAAVDAPATFTVHADARTAATSGPMTSGQAPATLTADLTGADWLRLTAESGAAAVHADWASPVLTCGDVPDDSPVLPVSRTLFSFETGTDGFTIANPGDGGTVARSPSSTPTGPAGSRCPPRSSATGSAGRWTSRSTSPARACSGSTCGPARSAPSARSPSRSARTCRGARAAGGAGSARTPAGPSPSGSTRSRARSASPSTWPTSAPSGCSSTPAATCTSATSAPSRARCATMRCRPAPIGSR